MSQKLKKYITVVTGTLNAIVSIKSTFQSIFFCIKKAVTVNIFFISIKPL